MLGALLSTLVFVNVAFGGILEPVLNFIPEEIQLCVVYAYGYWAVAFIASILPAIADFTQYIWLGLSALIFLWTFIMFIRVCRPSKHYRKFRGFTFFVNLLIAGIMGLNSYVLFTEGALSGDIYGMISFILSALFVFTFLYFILNLRGRVLAKRESNLDPRSFFGGPQGGGVPPRPPAPPQRPTAPPPPPVRRPPGQ